jgi:3-deoxy-D-manno-octulosonate 8-phosphate phosphatase (KDO 8-P phosphatase)
MITTLLSDVDGVITDGKYYLNDSGILLFKSFHANDHVAVRHAKKMGLAIKWITSASEPISFTILFKRAERMGVELIQAPYEAKFDAFNKLHLLGNETAYIGDCIDDIPIFKAVLLSFAPNDSLDMVKNAASVVLKKNGGMGCLLEAVVYIKERYYNNYEWY